MSGSSKLLQYLKIVSVAGIAVNSLVLAIFFVWAIFLPKAVMNEPLWNIFWASGAVGLPLSGLLYVGLKSREYLRDIHATLMKQ